jgi:2-polyprenyl-3-methyl-5-hydroxy-6-metoxy-1,4-benzoquinol methylase
MNCKLCGGNDVGIIYDGQIRNGGLECYTEKPVKMYKCNSCKVIWHESYIESKQYYESNEYRVSVNGTSDENYFYSLYDRATLEKLEYTGTDIYRGQAVADIGCAAGAFLDYVKGVAKDVIAIEPSEKFRQVCNQKGYRTFAYADEAVESLGGQLSVITSFDVIEHVDDPIHFMKNVYDLLKIDGKAIIGTPSEAPLMRDLLGDVYGKQVLFSVQHQWIFGEENLRYIADKVGFKKIKIKFYQRYGLDNLFGWLMEKKPNSNVNSNYISETMNKTFVAEMESRGWGDYIVLYVEK